MTNCITMNLEPCQLCLATNTSRSVIPIWDTVLLETPNFIVTPSIGPLVKGQVMISSRSHFSCLAAMPRSEIKECMEVAKTLIGVRNDTILFSEHGSFNKQKGGSCIEHTHIHVIPQYGRLFNILDSILPTASNISDINEIMNIANLSLPYILNFNDKGEVRVYEAFNAHSQMMRKGICNFLNRKDWDWKKTSHISLIHETVEEWSDLLKCQF